jgi:large subunit ribosomal protein L9
VKVIFVGDVPNVARVGQTKEVADGYARNFLFPRKLAVLANSQAAAAVDAHLKKLVKLSVIEEAKVAEIAKKIGGLVITLKAKVGENDKLYGSITGADIAEALSKSAGCIIDKKNIAIAEPIKQAGVCDVTVKFMHEIQAVIKVNVVDENATEEEIAKKSAEKAAEKAAAKKEKAETAAEPKKEKAEKPAKEKKAKAEKPAKEEKEADVAEKPAKAEKEEKPAKAEKEAKTAKEEKAEKPEKPAKEKKAKAEKAVKEEPEKTEEKKEKKPRAKAKKEESAG